MHLGKRPKLAIGSWQSRRIRLGVSHGGTPSSWIAPPKEAPAEKKSKKRR
jgi:hypothetical protein